MCHRNKSLLYAMPTVEIFERNTIEFGPVIGNDCLWKSKTTDDIPKNKIDNFLCGDRDQRFCLSPFYEVVNCNDGILRVTLDIDNTSMVSIPQTANGQELNIWVIFIDEGVGVLENLWHLSHFRVYSYVSVDS